MQQLDCIVFHHPLLYDETIETRIRFLKTSTKEKNMGKIETATQWMIDLANDDSHGYDQDSRCILTMTAPLPSFLHGSMQVFR